MPAIHRSLRIAHASRTHGSLAGASIRCYSTNPRGGSEWRQNTPNTFLCRTVSLPTATNSRQGQVSHHVLTSRLYSSTPATQPGVDVQTRSLSDRNNVATITVSNPNKLNIVNSAILEELVSSCNSLSNDSDLRAVVLTGGAPSPGKADSFIGGADIKEMNSLATADEARAFITRIHAVNKAIRAIPVPVIARINGFTLGAGLEIAVACDLRIATAKSVFGMPEVQVGIPSVVEAALLPGLIGMGCTRRLLYLAEILNAQVALNIGLVDEVVGTENALDQVIDEWVNRIAGMGPQAMRTQKQLIQKWENCSVDEGIAAGVDAFASAYADGGSEPHEYMGRFLNRKHI